MKSFCILAFLGLAAGRQLVANEEGSSQGNAVLRVVRLLKDLEKKMEADAEAEKDLYDKFTCWATSTVESKTKAIADAEARTDSLEAYIKKIEAGELTFTDDKEQRTKELKDVQDAIAADKAARAEAHAAYNKAKTDAESSRDGLIKAVELLSDAASGKLKSSLLALRGASSRLQEDQSLQKALEVSETYLSAANSHYLRRIILGEVHGEDKVSKPKADIVKKYESRNGAIIKKLKELKADFVKEIAKIEQTETDDVAAYDERKANMAEQETEATKALEDLVAENAARDKAKEESKAEIDDLAKQIKADTDMKAATETAMADKKAEMEKRVTYRTGELEALGQAIEALTSDEARDLFRKSVGVFFFQESSRSQLYASRARSASQALSSIARVTKDHRLLILAARLRSGEQPANPTFDVVLGKIDNMRKKIDDEETADLEKKDFCEKNLTTNLASKKKLERQIEDEEITVKYSQEKIEQLELQIEKNKAEDVEVAEQLQAAAYVRGNETAEYNVAKADDQAAIALIEKAKKFIGDFYASQQGFFLQLRSSRNDPLSDELRTAGADDPFKDKSYGGAGSQAGGVQETMQMVADDVKKEVAVADKEETEAQADYEAVKKSLEKEKADLKKARNDMLAKQADRTSDKTDAQSADESYTGKLEALIETMANVKPSCDFYLNNYDVRHKNRETELTGLDQAKSILKGAFFEDKDREIKPGDSFL
mmetsp:Transcript_89648/g.159221  ORF Transcript_89648/g.159221 Transcript_89648/m.159221 type:complete len:718 (+) Transcript_89648:58-2211(+)|eukprot:CAMPEP_0197660900 /NCGR_PEP_ID=MMETSP1338-20131121/51125_1 /TAXON_ID=43686 ORGANISM="Pelagodinium beii, Strain RCC1491" /NCGR_SAMPLE_ID=MMETSP1338 /ASSEMBLY_ACC=CAM_ASM_000754 /LENGTH=717 /DNA_ID=CAMNT_0043238351 /DNA_START=59 /DNA_END=2212 /DNA_ORIENTATION=+